MLRFEETSIIFSYKEVVQRLLKHNKKVRSDFPTCSLGVLHHVYLTQLSVYKASVSERLPGLIVLFLRLASALASVVEG